MRAIITWAGVILIALSAIPAAAQTQVEASMVDTPGTEAGFQSWIAAFRDRALAQGINAATFDAAMRGVTYNAGVVEKDRNQGEFTRAIWDYLDKAVSDLRVELGLRALKEHKALLDRLEATYGVDREIIVAVWGLESSYGVNRGDIPVIEALATLAYDTRRPAFFEAQLIAALLILQNGDVDAANMKGSWAGAMGHTQFMPTSFHTFAVDATGDGKRNIWGDDPTDALASTAAYLQKSAWQKGAVWGLEVALPPTFDYTQTGDRIQKTVAEWQALGVRTTTGSDLPDFGGAVIRVPAGVKGAAFLTFANFKAIENYNAADAYVIAIGHLADRLKGGAPIQASWPRDTRALQRDERIELQTLLTKAGFDTFGADGLIGPNTLAAVKLYQRSIGLIPDGYPSPDILMRLRRGMPG